MLKFYKSGMGCGWCEHIDILEIPNGVMLECGFWGRGGSQEKEVTVVDYTGEIYYLTPQTEEEFLSTAIIDKSVLEVLLKLF